MLNEQTIEKMNGMKLSAMAEAYEQQLSSGEHAKLSFEERIGLMVDCEWTAREQRKLTRRLRAAKPRYRSASLEDVDFKHPRGLKRQQVLSLGSCGWIQDRHNLLITGPTGIGKSYLACAFVERACRRGFTARYVRMSRLLHEIAIGRGDGSYTRLLTRLAKLDLLAIDDWMLAPLRDAERRDLIEVIEDRAEHPAIVKKLIEYALAIQATFIVGDDYSFSKRGMELEMITSRYSDSTFMAGMFFSGL